MPVHLKHTKGRGKGKKGFGKSGKGPMFGADGDGDTSYAPPFGGKPFGKPFGKGGKGFGKGSNAELENTARGNRLTWLTGLTALLVSRR